MPIKIVNKEKDKEVEFRDTDGGLCGTYHYGDRYKSFFRGLYTPKGHDVVAPPPLDHPHHKGLQYGLCAKDVNFWEEQVQKVTGYPDIPIGKQRTDKLEVLTGSEVIGFSQELTWHNEQDEMLVSFHETRKISVQRTPVAYVWTWQTMLTAARNLELVRSAWAQNPRQIGYCGLGLRLARDLFQKSTLVPDVESGSTPTSVAFQGMGAEVKFEQAAQQKDVLFVLFYSETNPGNFGFMSLGPTNGAERDIKNGDCLKGSYVISVSDR